jgi:UDP-GlcNAc:undecaprenyl-phosphate/decaprenyl-phosphate GlcNAc-1-phosphate transferase
VDHHVLGLLAALLLSVLFTPIIKRVAPLVGAVDRPNQRKVHKRAMPRLGGVAIYLSFAISYIGFVQFTDIVATNIGYALLLGGGIIVLTGIIDDIVDLGAKVKVAGQIAAALVTVYFGLRIEDIAVPFTEYTIHFHYLAIPITIFWILAITNAVNLIDGLDGLAAGVSAIAATALLIVSISMGHWMTAFMLVLFIGAVLGFLLFNFYPASIFMGDSGSLFLGYVLASVSLLELKSATMVAFVIPILILAVPISDTVYAMVRRRMNKQSIAEADKNHVHHCLIKFGMTHRNAVLLIYGISAAFALLGILATQVTLWMSILFFIIYLISFGIFAEKIGMVSKEYQPFQQMAQLCKRWFTRTS